MNRLFALLAVVAAGVVLAVLTRHDPGYVLIAWNDWQFEVRSLVAAGALLLGLWYLLYLLASGVRGARGLPGRWRGRRARQSVRDLEQGVTAVLSGELARVEGIVLRHQPGLLHYLLAAFAAAQRGDPRRREELLARARRCPHAEPAATLFEARCLLDAGLAHAAETLLDGLGSRGGARSPGALRLLMQARRGAGSHWALITQLPRLRRAGVLDRDTARQAEIEAHAALLDALPDPLAHWQRVPRALRTDPAAVAAYARALTRVQRTDEAVTVVGDALARAPHPQLTALYGTLAASDAQAQLARAEAWLAQRPRDAALLHALGRIAVRAGQWNRARSFLETAVSLEANPAARQELADLLLDLGDREAALTHLRTGLRDALANAPA